MFAKGAAREAACGWGSSMRESLGISALTRSADGTSSDPATRAEWDDWVAAGKTRNWLEEDPLLDWLGRYGPAKGFVPDTDLDGYDPRTDMRRFILDQGLRFEDGVVALIRDRLSTVRISDGWRDARELEKAVATVDAMREGVPVIEQAVLRNPANRTYGVADLLVRSDLLNKLVPGTLDPDEARMPAPGIGATAHHYRVVDIKFRTLELLAHGGAAASQRPYLAQVWIYNEALGRIQGFTPPASYLLGRSWKQGDDRGDGCFDRLARVDHDRLVVRGGSPLADEVAAAVEWLRRLRRDGGAWEVLPVPSVPELYPHARNVQDQPWHTAKTQIAAALHELTLLPGMAPLRRRAAHDRGIGGWDDPRATATALGVETQYAGKCDAVLAINRDTPELMVTPMRINRVDADWRAPASLEFYVDFETVNNLADDFVGLPRIGGQPLIFQIGCGSWNAGSWQFEQWTAERLTGSDEATMIDGWVAHMDHLREGRGLAWPDVRIVHWSPAESSNLTTAYNSAQSRHPDRTWLTLPWFDFLAQVIRKEPVAVRGAFGFGLKGIVKGMHTAGLIETTWDEGPTDGLGAMIGAWWCDAEAAKIGGPMLDLGLMQEIARYNEVDCRSMAEVVRWLRANR